MDTLVQAKDGRYDRLRRCQVTEFLRVSLANLQFVLQSTSSTQHHPLSRRKV